MKSKPKVPGGVIAFGIIHIILHSFFLIGNLNILTMSSNLDRTAQIMNLNYEYLLISIIIGLSLGLLGLVGGISIFSMKELGRKFLFWIGLIAIILSVVRLIYTFTIPNLSGNLVVLLLIVIYAGYQGLVIWYFTKKDIKKLFS